ncbi:MAG: hypothetical protein AAB922_04030, partial [Patescibacteria group bacterium]
MKDSIPSKVISFYEKLEKAGFDVYFVGGGVRNILMKIPVKDWDITTNATPEEIVKLFPDSYYNNDFGTVGVPLGDESLPAGRQVVEIT